MGAHSAETAEMRESRDVAAVREALRLAAIFAAQSLGSAEARAFANDRITSAHVALGRLAEVERQDPLAGQRDRLVSALREIVRRDARSEYSSHACAPAEFARIASDALKEAGL